MEAHMTPFSTPCNLPSVILLDPLDQSLHLSLLMPVGNFGELRQEPQLTSKDPFDPYKKVFSLRISSYQIQNNCTYYYFSLTIVQWIVSMLNALHALRIVSWLSLRN